MRIILLLLLLTACSSATSYVVKEFSEPTEVYFCPRDNCRNIFASKLINASEIKCALYDTDVPEFIKILNIKNARLVIDDQSSNLSNLNGVIDSKYSQMHNKFCILDNKTVITGSMNPTLRDTSLNNNNLIIFHSKKLASAYNDEFQELYSKTFSGGEKTRGNYYVNNDEVELFFCPEYWCANKVLYALDKAEQSIYFMTFSFTHDQIGDLLIKKKNQGIIIKGIMERTQSGGQYSEFEKLNESGIDITKDKNKGNMHHKVFIIDESVVITGSFNPSLNGDTSNDENMVIVHSPEIAKRYVEEFNLIKS